MPSAPRSTASRLVCLLRRMFPDHTWSVEGVDVLGGTPITPEADAGVPPLFWCAIGQGKTHPLWILGRDGAATVVRKGGFHAEAALGQRVLYATSSFVPKLDRFPTGRAATVTH